MEFTSFALNENNQVFLYYLIGVGILYFVGHSFSNTNQTLKSFTIPYWAIALILFAISSNRFRVSLPTLEARNALNTIVLFQLIFSIMLFYFLYSENNIAFAIGAGVLVLIASFVQFFMTWNQSNGIASLLLLPYIFVISVTLFKLRELYSDTH